MKSFKRQSTEIGKFLKRVFFLFVLGVVFLLAPQAGLKDADSSSIPEPAKQETKAVHVKVNNDYGKLPLSFEANDGQVDSQVKFLSRGQGYNLFLTPTEAVLSLSRPKEIKKEFGTEEQRVRDELNRKNQPQEMETSVIRMQMVGANPSPVVSGQEKLPGVSNYLKGKDKTEWRTGVSNYKKVRYEEVYSGIDLVYYGNQRKLEYDFVVKPEADYKTIRMNFEGVEKLSLDDKGNLILNTKTGDVIQQAPIIYQEVEGARKPVDGNYVLFAENKVGFEVAEYDTRKTLVIDPVLTYSTYIGGSQSDYSEGIAANAAGEIYIVGYTSSTDFPTTSPVLQETGGSSGAFDGLIVKINAQGTGLVYSTYLGGDTPGPSGTVTRVKDILVNSNGEAIIAGEARALNFPTTTPVLQETYGGGVSDTFVAKLNANGTDLIFSTFLGGSGEDIFGAIDVDGSGNVYVTGKTLSSDFPVLNAYQSTIPGNESVFVSKLNPGGTALVYSTYVGGTNSVTGEGIAVDSSGAAYVTATLLFGDFPITSGAFQTTYGGDLLDAVVFKLDPTGANLEYSTYLGGSSFDIVGDIAVDDSGSAIISGHTRSADFPTTPGAHDITHNGGDDFFVTKLNPSGSDAVFSTLLGGSDADSSSKITIDSSGNIFVVGQTHSSDFPMLNPTQGTYGGAVDIPFFVMDSAGNLVFSTYLGGSLHDSSNALAILGEKAYLTGVVQSTDFPTVNPYQTQHNGSVFDIFVTTIDLSDVYPKDYTVTAHNDAQLKTGEKKFGTASIYFDGDDDYLSIADSSDWQWGDGGTGPFTVDFWINFSADPANTNFFKQSIGFNIQNQFRHSGGGLSHDSLNGVLSLHGPDAASDPFNPTLNQWYHLALVRESSKDFKVYINGNQSGPTINQDRAVVDIGAPLIIGAWRDDIGQVLQEITGYLDEFRVSNVARWTGNFTPPAVPHTVDANTLRLIHFDGDDGSTNIVDSVEVPPDTELPVIVLNGENPVTHEAGGAYTDAGATATDNEPGVGSIVVGGDTVDTSTVGTYNITYDVADAAGNDAVTVTRIVNVVDTTKPVIVATGDNSVTHEAGGVYTDAGATATDNATGPLNIVTGGDTVDINTVGSYNITYDVTDAASNVADTVTRTVNVVDTTQPVIVVTGTNPVTHEAGGAYTDAGATATDNATGPLNIVTGGDTVDTSTVGSYNITYDVTDAASNVADTVTRTVNVVDTTQPVIVVTGTNPVTHEAGDPYTDAGATATDNATGPLNIVTGGDTVNINSVGSYNITYDVTDAASNVADTVTRTVNVVDTIKPVIELLGENPISLELGEAYAEAGANVTDNANGPLNLVINDTDVDINAVGSYEVTYDVTDAAGNDALRVTRTVNVVTPATPQIHLLGENPVNLEVGSNYIDEGAIVTDDVDNNLSVTVAGLPIDTSVVGGPFSIRYNVTDSDSNVAVEVIRTVNVVDTTPPTIVLKGENPITVEAANPYTDPGATASDAVDDNGVLTGNIQVDSSAVNTSAPGGPFPVTFDVTDSSNNDATRVTRMVLVEDTTPPAITVMDVVVEAGGPVTTVDLIPNGPPIAIDSVDGPLTAVATPGFFLDDGTQELSELNEDFTELDNLLSDN